MIDYPSPVASAATSPIDLRGARDAVNFPHYLHLGSTIRGESPASTLAKLQWVMPAMGITRVANVTGLDHIGIPVALCIRPNAKHLSVSQGKGQTWELAKISAIMEAIEGYHAENPQPSELHGSYSQLQAHYPLAHPHLFSNNFFQMPDIARWSLDWIRGHELMTATEIYLPHALIHLDSTRVQTEYGFFSVSSNGLAGGNTREEAICHGIYELIERDCILRWQALTPAQQQQTQLRLESIDSPGNQDLLAKFQQAQIDVKIWDISLASGIPAFIAEISDSNLLRGLQQFRGSGAHLVKDIALSRALTEAAQSRLTLISGSRDDIFPAQYVRQKSFQTIEETLGQRDYSHCVSPPLAHSFVANLRFLLDHLRAQNFQQVFVVDHSRPEWNIPIVHVFIPGMKFNGHRI